MLPAAVVDRHIRVRYSALTPEEVKAAFAKPSTVDFNLAEAAHSRQDIDLIWGAVLTRFMSLASYRYGSDYLSVGRVQSPTLRLRRRPRARAARLRAGAVLGDQGDARARRRAVRGRARQGPLRHARGHARRPSTAPSVETAEVTGYKAEPRQDKPPAPFNTTALMSAASGAGMTPARAMRAAESLYLDGLISYPRTDNTVYPPSLDLHGSLRELCALAAGRGHRGAARRAGQAHAHARQEAHHRPPADLPGGRAQEGAQRRPGQGLRPRRAPLPRHAAAGGRHREPARRRAASARSRSWRTAAAWRRSGTSRSTRSTPPSATGRCRRCSRATRSRCSTCARRPRRRSRRPLRPGQAHREDGGARAGHQGHARRHHPAPLRPQLRARQPRRAHRARHGAHRRLRRGHGARRRSTSPPAR